MINLKEVKHTDPVKPQAEKGLEGDELSPMAPPEEWEAPALPEKIPVEKFPSFLKSLVEPFEEIKSQVDDFKKALHDLRNSGWKWEKKRVEHLSTFFRFFDETLIPQIQKEERIFFPTLRKRMVENGEVNPETSSTPISVIEKDHLEIIQSIAVAFNLLNLGANLPEQRSGILTFEFAYQEGLKLAENIRVHLMRKEEKIIPLALEYLTENDWQTLNNDNN